MRTTLCGIFCLVLAGSLVLFAKEPAPTGKTEPEEKPAAAFELPLAKDTYFLIAGANCNSVRCKGPGLTPFMGIHVPKTSKAEDAMASVTIREFKSKANGEPLVGITSASSTKSGGGTLPYDFEIAEGDVPLSPEKIAVPLELDGVTACLIPYAKTKEGAVRSVVVLSASSISKLKALVKTTEFNFKFNWTDWFMKLDD